MARGAALRHTGHMTSIARPGFVDAPTRFVFFTGKGGVGKTSLSTATAIALGATALVSADGAFDEVPGLAVVRLDAEDVVERLT